MSRFGQRLVTFTDQLVRARFRGGGDVHAERRFPQHAEILPVQGNFGEIFHRAEIEPEFAAGGQTVGGNFNFLFVSGRAGKITHAGVGVVGPGNQFVQRDRRRRAPVRRKTQIPCAGHFLRRGQVRRVRVQNFSAGSAQFDPAIAPRFHNRRTVGGNAGFPLRRLADGCRCRQRERFIFRHGRMAGLAVERVVHAQFLYMIHCRITAQDVVVCRQ